jgi:hypothetical protein
MAFKLFKLNLFSEIFFKLRCVQFLDMNQNEAEIQLKNLKNDRIFPKDNEIKKPDDAQK